MKKSTIIIMMGLLLSMACSDILEENPKALTTEGFYNTKEEIEGALYSAYNGTGRATAKSTFAMVLVNAGEVDYGEGRVTFAPYSDFRGELITDNRIPQAWDWAYQGIRNANLVIQNAPNSTEASQTEIEQLVSEAKFIRAFTYFQLVRNWGGVPLRTEENNMLADVPRSSIEDVYALITDDLLEAERFLPENQSIIGRADKFAAKTMLADVYLELGNWTAAKDKALEVINSNRYSLINVSTSDDFYKIFGVDVNGSSEEIFYIKSNDIQYTYFCNYRHHPNVPYWKGGGGAHALYTDSVSNKFIRDWDYNDLRKKFMLYNLDIGFGPTTMLFKKYIDPDTANGGRNDWPAYRYTDVLLIYAEADCRANGGPTTDGMEKLNMIHRRAYGYNPIVPSTIDFNITDYNEETFIDLVLREGGYEQMDEGKRFFALRRTGKLKEAVQYARGIDVSDTHMLWPIPASEFLYNGAIDPNTDQNPGY